MKKSILIVYGASTKLAFVDLSAGTNVIRSAKRFNCVDRGIPAGETRQLK